MSIENSAIAYGDPRYGRSCANCVYSKSHPFRGSSCVIRFDLNQQSAINVADTGAGRSCRSRWKKTRGNCFESTTEKEEGQEADLCERFRRR